MYIPLVSLSFSFSSFYFFFFNAPATTEIYTLSLHDALPICSASISSGRSPKLIVSGSLTSSSICIEDRKSTRLNSSHDQSSYAGFCLKKKNRAAAVEGPHRQLRARLADRLGRDDA